VGSGSVVVVASVVVVGASVVVVVGSVVVVVDGVVVVVVVVDDDVVGGWVVVVVDVLVEELFGGRVVVVEAYGRVVVVGPAPIGAVDGGVVVPGAPPGLGVPRRRGRATGISGLAGGALVVVESPAMVVGGLVVVGIASPGPTVVAAARTAASSLGSQDLVGSLSASSTSVIALASA